MTKTIIPAQPGFYASRGPGENEPVVAWAVCSDSLQPEPIGVLGPIHTPYTIGYQSELWGDGDVRPLPPVDNEGDLK